MGNYVELNDGNFEQEVIKSDIPVLVDFWAEWCAPCRMIAPIVEDISVEFKDKLKVGKLDVDNNPQVSMNYGIRSIPTLLIFMNGKAEEQIVGAVPKKTLLEKLSPFIK
ncbi:MAG: thioredoxin [Calditrichaceae bacterium]